MRSAAVNRKLQDLDLAEKRKGLYRVFDLKREYTAQWDRFLRPLNAEEDHALVLEGLVDPLPFFTRTFAKKQVLEVQVLAKMNDRDKYKLAFLPFTGEDDPTLTGEAELLTLDPSEPYSGLHHAKVKDLGAAPLNSAPGLSRSEKTEPRGSNPCLRMRSGNCY